MALAKRAFNIRERSPGGPAWIRAAAPFRVVIVKSTYTLAISRTSTDNSVTNTYPPNIGERIYRLDHSSQRLTAKVRGVTYDLGELGAGFHEHWSYYDTSTLIYEYGYSWELSNFFGAGGFPWEFKGGMSGNAEATLPRPAGTVAVVTEKIMRKDWYWGGWYNNILQEPWHWEIVYTADQVEDMIASHTGGLYFAVIATENMATGALTKVAISPPFKGIDLISFYSQQGDTAPQTSNIVFDGSWYAPQSDKKWIKDYPFVINGTDGSGSPFSYQITEDNMPFITANLPTITSIT